MAKPTNEVITRYRKKTYKTIVVRIRYDDPVYEKLEEFSEANPKGLNALILWLLKEHFGK